MWRIDSALAGFAQFAQRGAWVFPRGQTLPLEVWRRRHRALFALLCLHAIGLAVFGALQGYGAIHSIAHGGVLATVAAVAYAARRRCRLASVVVSLGLITSSALAVHMSGGAVEAHFHFFVMIVVLALYEDWLPFLLSAAYVVVHHGVAGALDSQAVYNHPDAIAHPWKWALIHGAFVTAAGLASVIAWRLNESVREQALAAYQRARKSERALAEAQALAGLGSWTWDARCDVVDWSEQMRHIYGVDAAGAPQSLAKVLEFVHPDDRQLMTATMQHSAVSGEPFCFEHKIVRPDGVVRVISARGEVVMSDDGPVRMFGTAQDFTERRDSEQAQRQLAALVDSCQDAIIGNSLDGTIVSWNRGAQRLYGYSAAEVLGRPLTTLTPSDRRQQLSEILARIGGGERVDELQTAGVRKDGRMIDVALTISPITDGTGAVVGASAIARDISEQKLRERYLKIQHDTTRVLAHAATTQEALPALLKAIGEGIGWAAGAFWMRAREGSAELRCKAFWYSGTAPETFEKVTKRISMVPGNGLPGRVWEHRRARWVQDLTVEPDSRRSEPAAADGLHACILLPVLSGDDILGVIEFVSYDMRSRDPALLEMLDTLSAPIAQFLERKRRDEQLAHQARHDALTGLPNRRKLLADLDRAITDATHGQPQLLLMLDLDGFKAYNDSFGHAAGDALLTRLAGRLAATMRGHGTSYRMGGDEFCVIAALPGDGEQALVDRARSALSERGEAFEITASCGSALLPVHAGTPSEALKLADRRMYAAKGSNKRASAAHQIADVLLQALSERSPQLGAHLDEVSELSEAVARALGIPDDQISHLLRAASLHDVGKTAIPEAILDKPGPLDQHEWAYIRRHTLIGERILAAAPALAPAARLVRSSHERVDGRGYPDGLSGEQIPLGARIIAVCDAFDAMTTDRPYRHAVSAQSALAELRAHSGTQFDIAVVDALSAVIAERHATLAPMT